MGIGHWEWGIGHWEWGIGHLLFEKLLTSNDELLLITDYLFPDYRLPCFMSNALCPIPHSPFPITMNSKDLAMAVGATPDEKIARKAIANFY
ncbi:MAG: hypothetical protein EAZ25_16430 [Oscillatoriales cyanobacterium]|nr:MAG: hypothetical protein EAZ25_16430 [Oscillatoriales cyanobacterium]